MRVYTIKEAYFTDIDIIEIENYNIYLEGYLTTSDEDNGENIDIYIDDNEGYAIPFDKDKIVDLIKEYGFEFNDDFKQELLKIIEG